MGFYGERVRPRLLEMGLTERLTGETRGRVCRSLAGDVLEIGMGSALNQPHLPDAVTGVWGIEPSVRAIRLGAERRAASPIPVVVAGADAQTLPFPDDRFDAALCTWVLCGIPDPGRALAEVGRVLKPGGVFSFVEHGLAPDPGVVRWQRRGNRINRAVFGCLLDNDVSALLEASPLTVERMTTYYDEGAPRAVGSMYEGTAIA